MTQKNLNMNREDCKGCKTDNPDGSCTWFIKDTKTICPCSICLIKMICSNSCSDFLLYSSSVNKSMLNRNGDL